MVGTVGTIDTCLPPFSCLCGWHRRHCRHINPPLPPWFPRCLLGWQYRHCRQKRFPGYTSKRKGKGHDMCDEFKVDEKVNDKSACRIYMSKMPPCQRPLSIECLPVKLGTMNIVQGWEKAGKTDLNVHLPNLITTLVCHSPYHTMGYKSLCIFQLINM